MSIMNVKYLLLVITLVGFFACEEPDLFDEPATYENMIGTWNLIERGPELGVPITDCEKREYLIFRADYSVMRHQDCLPKSDTIGSWQIIDGKCMVRIDVVFRDVQISTIDEPVAFELIATDKLRVENQYPLFLAYGIYQKVQE